MQPCRFCGFMTDSHSVSYGAVCLSCWDTEINTCDACEDTILTDDAIVDSFGNRYCADCHGRYYHFCNACGEQVNNNRRWVHEGQTYCNSCRERFANNCCDCGQLVRGYDICRSEDAIYCPTCFDNTYTYCYRCDTSYRRDEMTEDSNGFLCEACESRRECWDMKVFEPEENTCEEIESKRTFGVEIETDRCSGYSQIYPTTIWGCINDYSISGKEFISPPLSGDKGLAEIRGFCEEACTRQWRVNSTCGLHIHIGMGDLSPTALQRVAYAYHLTYKLWSAFVSPERDGNRMCGAPRCSIEDILEINTDDYEGWDIFVSKQDRFEFLNWRAFIVHGTVEFRGLEGTLDGDLICNWVKAHVKFIEYVSKKSLEDIELMFTGVFLRKFSAFAEIVGSGLASYYVSVSDNHGKWVVANQNHYLPF